MKVFTQAVFNVIHRPANEVTLVVYFTKMHSQDGFTVLVAMPNTAINHIQNKAPGPPAAMAVATPAILPVPIVADRHVISALKPEISPSPLPLRLLHKSTKPDLTLRMG